MVRGINSDSHEWVCKQRPYQNIAQLASDFAHSFVNAKEQSHTLNEEYVELFKVSMTSFVEFQLYNQLKTILALN